MKFWHVTTQMNLENIILHARSQTQKVMCYMIPFVRRNQNRYRGWGKRGNGGDDNILKLNRGSGCTALWMYKSHWIVHFNMVTFMLSQFHLNFQKKMQLQKKKIPNAFRRQPCARYGSIKMNETCSRLELVEPKAFEAERGATLWSSPSTLQILSLVTTITTMQTSRGAVPPTLVIGVGMTQNASFLQQRNRQT